MCESISAATEEQTVNAKQVARAVEDVNELTQQAAAASEEMSAATEELSALAEQMQRLVERFRIDEEAAVRSLPAPEERASHLGRRAEETVSETEAHGEVLDRAHTIVLKRPLNGKVVHS